MQLGDLIFQLAVMQERVEEQAAELLRLKQNEKENKS